MTLNYAAKHKTGTKNGVVWHDLWPIFAKKSPEVTHNHHPGRGWYSGIFKVRYDEACHFYTIYIR